MSVPRLQLDSISHSFYGVTVNRDVNLTVGPGEVLGLVGENGAGKSTLMNIVGGLIRPVEGKLFVDGEPYAPHSPAEARRHGIAHVHQELNLFSQLSVTDNVFLTAFPRKAGVFTDRKRARQQTIEALALLDLEFPPGTLVENLSPGQRQMLEIAKAAVGDPKLMILDEPTTSLTSRETRKLFELIGRMTSNGTSIIYVSHILEDVKRLSDRIAIMRDGALVEVRDEQALPTAELITLMVGRSLDKRFPDRSGAPGADTVLAVDKLSATGVVEDVSLRVNAGEVVGLFGLMGAGRTELARLIYGLDAADSGTITIGGRDITGATTRSRIASGLSFVTEDRRGEGLLMDYAVTTNAALPSLRRWARWLLGPLNRRQLGNDVAEVTSDLRLKAANLTESPVRSLSGGNQQKVVLAKWLLTRPKLLILDEPTRGVDVGAQYEVYRTALELADSGTGLLAISSELPELIGICDRILVMRMGRIVAEFPRDRFEARRILGAAFGEAPPVPSEVA
ncbi:sugar ABC transporter ATP-binding protein [Microcella flavibacter]|uniref:sugar ABC transporter ATP-binding protein n=1 Tax=Microcella flavibacter TaxID=1804990 RepID=UPI00145747E9|nr:sugar ABC transporter ATP-binding protein [Microcella flavibacter]